MADEEVDFEEDVDLGDAPMEETAGGAASDGGKKGRDATGRRCCGDTYCGDGFPWLHLLRRCIPWPHGLWLLRQFMGA
jgi:hypothetical protein